jgi:hypothetical protein
MLNEHIDHTRRADKALTNSKEGEKDVPYFREKLI